MPKKRNSIRNLIFDLGGVLIGLDVQQTVKGLEKLGIRIPEDPTGKETFFQQFRMLERGEISAADFRDGLRQYTQQQVSDEALDQAWRSMLTEYSPEAISFLRAASNGYRLLLLSNTNEIHVPHFTWKYHEQTGEGSLENLFDKVYYSHILHMRKPEERIFRHVLNDAGIVAEETLFIDDYEENVEAARKLGIHAYQYRFGEDVASIVGRFMQ